MNIVYAVTTMNPFHEKDRASERERDRERKKRKQTMVWVRKGLYSTLALRHPNHFSTADVTHSSATPCGTFIIYLYYVLLCVYNNIYLHKLTLLHICVWMWDLPNCGRDCVNVWPKVPRVEELSGRTPKKNNKKKKQKTKKQRLPHGGNTIDR